MKEKKTISWLIGQQDWAYKNLMTHNKKAMPEYEHTINTERQADIIIGMYPQSVKDIKNKYKSIIHLDSRRIIGQ